MCLYVRERTCECLRVCVLESVVKSVYLCMFVFESGFMFICMCMYLRKCLSMYICICEKMCVCLKECVHVHICVCTKSVYVYVGVFKSLPEHILCAQTCLYILESV